MPVSRDEWWGKEAGSKEAVLAKKPLRCELCDQRGLYLRAHAHVDDGLTSDPAEDLARVHALADDLASYRDLKDQKNSDIVKLSEWLQKEKCDSSPLDRRSLCLRMSHLLNFLDSFSSWTRAIARLARMRAVSLSPRLA